MCEACPRMSRRSMLAGLAATAAMLPARRLLAAPPPGADAPNAIGGDAALERLMRGNTRYTTNRIDARDFSAGRVARARVQYPIAAVLGCADSRVSPEFAFDQGPGDLFVVRVAGNVLDDDATASLEYAALVLGVPLVMVLGHTACGAVSSAVKASAPDAKPLPGHLPGLIAKIMPAVVATKDVPEADRLTAAIVENVRLTAKQVSQAPPVLSALVSAGKVKVVGAMYELATGHVRLVDIAHT